MVTQSHDPISLRVQTTVSAPQAQFIDAADCSEDDQ